MLDPIVLSRIQFALTLSFHILFPTLTIGLAGYLVVWEIAWLRTGREEFYRLCRFWTKLFALAFGLGVVSGLVLSYEFGTNFSKFSELTGNVLGPLMGYEVLTAFFLEAGFLGIMLFGWRRVSKPVHLAATILVALGTLVSAFWILSANSWMHTPAGYVLKDGVFYPENWWRVIFNPSFPYRYLHMVLASYLTVSVFVAGVSAWYLRRGQEVALAKRAFGLATGVMLVLAPAQILLGDLHGLNTLKHQPIKIAAMEGRWESMSGAPLTLFGVPDQKAEKTHLALDVPRAGSLILTHEWDGEIVGLKTVPKEDRPYVPMVFFAFRLMVGIGMAMLGMALWGAWLRLRGKLFTQDLYLRLCVWMSPLGFLAVLAGWFTTETGRQPWVVYGLLRTKDAASVLPAGSVLTSLLAFVALYTGLLAAFLWYLRGLMLAGPEAPASDKPDRLTAWVEKQP